MAGTFLTETVSSLTLFFQPGSAIWTWDSPTKWGWPPRKLQVSFCFYWCEIKRAQYLPRLFCERALGVKLRPHAYPASPSHPKPCITLPKNKVIMTPLLRQLQEQNGRARGGPYYRLAQKKWERVPLKLPHAKSGLSRWLICSNNNVCPTEIILIMPRCVSTYSDPVPQLPSRLGKALVKRRVAIPALSSVPLSSGHGLPTAASPTSLKLLGGNWQCHLAS